MTLAQLDDDDWSELKVCLENPGLHTIWQNAAFDIRVLQGCGINLGGRFDDTMLMSWLLNNGIPTIKNNLAAIAYREVGVKLDKTLQSQNWMTAELNEEDMAYAMGDVEITWQVYESMLPKIKDQALTIPYEVELKALLPTIQMESTGLYSGPQAHRRSGCRPQRHPGHLAVGLRRGAGRRAAGCR